MFFRQRKQYKKVLKYKEKQYRKQIIDKLNEGDIHNAKEYWGIVDELKELNCASSPKYTSSLVSTDEWYKHFKNLLFKNESPDELTQTLKLRDQIRELKLNHEAASSECGLNKDISDSEISPQFFHLRTRSLVAWIWLKMKC